MLGKKVFTSFFRNALLILFLISGLSFLCFAQGLNIPAGSTVKINNDTLNVAGSIVNAGTISTTTGTVGLTGDWTNNGTYTPTAGTFKLYAPAGIQTLNLPNTSFYNLSHTGTGTAKLNNGLAVIGGSFFNTAGTFDMNGQNMNVTGNWTGAAAATFIGTNVTVTLVGNNQSVLGTTNAFYNLNKIGTDTLIFDSTGIQYVAGTLTLKGTGVGTELSLNSNDDDGTPVQFTVNMNNGSSQALQYLKVKNGNAANLDMVARNSIDVGGNDTLQPSPHWVFNTGTLTWKGTTSSDWNVAANWDLGIVPFVGDNVIIPNVTGSGGVQPVLTGDINVGTMSVQAGATINFNSFKATIINLSNSGNVLLWGFIDQLHITTSNKDAGTFTFTGDGVNTNTTRTLPQPNFGDVKMDYYNVIINNADATDTFIIDKNLNIFGSLTLTKGTFDISTNAKTLTVANATGVGGNLNMGGGVFTAGNGNIVVNKDSAGNNGSFVMTAGTFTAPGLGKTFSVQGNFTSNGGNVTSDNFNANGGLVLLNGVNQTISAVNTNFYDLTKTTAVPATLTFDTTVAKANSPLIAHQLTLKGAAGNLLSINSSAPTTQAYFELKFHGIQDLDFLDVRDSNVKGRADAGVLLVPSNSTQINGNNTNWLFGPAEDVWNGSNGTSWDDPLNWDLGFIPRPIDGAKIPNVPNQPTLATPVSIVDLKVANGAVVTLNGINIIMTGKIFNNAAGVDDGTIKMLGTETPTIQVDAGFRGTFIYTGDNNGVLNQRTILNIPYYNLILNDINAVPDNYRTTADLVVNHDLTITNGSLDTSNASNLLTVGHDLLLNGAAATNGILNAVNGKIAVLHDVSITGGELKAPATIDANNHNTFKIAGSFTRTNPGLFTPGTGEINFNTASTATITGSTTFYSLYSNELTKTIKFAAGSTQTIAVGGSFNVRGTEGINGDTTGYTSLLSTASPGTWNLNLLAAGLSTQNLKVQDSDVLGAPGNDLICNMCTNLGNNDVVNPNPKWNFVNLNINYPFTGKTVGQYVTVIGSAIAGTLVIVKDGSDNEIGRATTDANGNFVIQNAPNDALNIKDPNKALYSNMQLAVGANALRLYAPDPINPGAFIKYIDRPIVVVANPTVEQVPVIVSPAMADRVNSPRPVVSGNADTPSVLVDILAQDDAAAHNLLLQKVGSLVKNAGGTAYSGILTTDLTRGAIKLVAVSDGVASRIITVSLVDPFGYVFDSVSDHLIKGAVVTIYNAATNLPAKTDNIELSVTDTNPVTTLADGYYSFLAAPGDYYIKVEVNGYDFPSVEKTFPAGRTVATGSLGEHFTVGANVMQLDMPVDSAGTLIKIEKSVNKNQIHVGEVATYTVKMESISSNDIIDPYLKDIIPPGFKFLPGRVTLDGLPTADPIGNRPLMFYIGNADHKMTPGMARTLKYQLVVGSGVVPGTYENKAQAVYRNGTKLSNTSRVNIKVAMDPLFDMGTVIGKVFWDQNENGIQDAPEYSAMGQDVIREEPVPNVTLAMEDGTVITTDKNGQFSIPGLTPGRHVVRLDERTLPEGAYLTTDKAVIIDVTNGMINKVNFGVNMDYGRFKSDDAQFFMKNVTVQKDQTVPVPLLNADMFGNQIDIRDGIFLNKVEFRIFTNYPLFISQWKLIIQDKYTKSLVKKFEGDRYTIDDPIFWDGKDQMGRYIDVKKDYEYYFIAKDEHNRTDETKIRPIVFRDVDEFARQKQAQEDARDITKLSLDKETQADTKLNPTNYADWVRQASETNNLAKQSISLNGEMVVISKLAGNLKSIQIKKDGRLEMDVPLTTRTKVTAQDVLNGKVADDINTIRLIMPNGNYDFLVQEGIPAVPAEGASPVNVIPTLGAPALPAGTLVSPTGIPLAAAPGDNVIGGKTYVKNVRVGENYMFLVGMGDEKVGYNFNKGNMEAVSPADQYNTGLYSQGRAAYYLKGKILGKYLITSSLDTDRQNSALFKKLDPDKFYPVYGDNSSINYSATDTQGPLYLLVEWDKSSAQWSNYSIDFKDTDFARFARSYYGGKVDLESLGTTKFGEPDTKAVVFYAQAHQKTAHNEFLATGTSLYYLKNKEVVEGSDKIRAEVRDRVTGVVVSTQDLKEGSDYDIDYPSGRVIFWRPVPQIVTSTSIVSNNILDGNLVYVVADYAYSVSGTMNEASEGTRLAKAIGNHLIIGETYVKEEQQGGNYQLTGTDATLHVGDNAKVKAEVAETTSNAQDTYLSTDGGLSFTSVSAPAGSKNKAYGISGDATLFNRLGLTAAYRWIDNNFSTTDSTAQQGKELVSLAATYDITDHTRLRLRHDIQTLLDGGSTQTKLQVGGQKTTTTLAQIVHDVNSKLRLTAEFSNQAANALSPGDTTFASPGQGTLLAFQADYQVNDKLSVMARRQQTLSGTPNDQNTVGATIKPTDKTTVDLKYTNGQMGASAQMAAKYDVNKSVTAGKLVLKANYDIAANPSISTSTGATSQTYNTALGQNQATVGAEYSPNEKNKIETDVGLTDLQDKEPKKLVSFGGKSQIDRDSAVESKLSYATNSLDQDMVMTFGGRSQVDPNTTTTSGISVADTTRDGKDTKLTFGTEKKLNSEVSMLTTRSFGQAGSQKSTGDEYGLVREKDNVRLKGTLTRQLADAPDSITQSNIFGLTGDIGDRWALSGSYERGKVQNYNGTITDRDAYTLGVGYAKADEQTGEKVLTSSVKAEYRKDTGSSDMNQYLVYASAQGKVSPELTLYAKGQYTNSQNMDQETTLTSTGIPSIGTGTIAMLHQVTLGAAYRPLMMDKLNLIGEVTHKEEQSPASQADATNSDIQQSIADIFSAEGLYDIDEHWQVGEKFAYRMAKEKVAGFDFTNTHTWLMIHRINYKIDRDWMIGGEFRILAQHESRDMKSGFLIEAARRLNDFAQLGVGFNFTDYNDDLTSLSFASRGPFVRLTGKFYDRTPDEIARSNDRWVEEKISHWAWAMVEQELSNPQSPIMQELNTYYKLAQKSANRGSWEESFDIYRDIVLTGQMMYEEAASYIRTRVAQEKQLVDMKQKADDYYRTGQYEKAKKILEKLLEDAKKGVIE
ncbi:MAG: hypothetical protein HQL26_04190 [Candidatus Omnitrophica bacterium]|nr:hypothetical protein [Candidatus Omnitrophota bacterium]